MQFRHTLWMLNTLQVKREFKQTMKYRKDKYGNDLSILGFGCMRFPKKTGRIDVKETERQIMAAIEGGVNYFDSAYIYPGSEAALGEILEKNNARDRVNIATKLPHYLIKSIEGLEKIFQEELRRLRTNHIDYYLMHMLTDVGAWEGLKQLGIEDWIREKKESGAIRQVGFSYHGNSHMFCKLIDAWDWDFTMIQYNYMDENSQAGRRGLNYAADKGVPVIIMEPLRGGRLARDLPSEAKAIMEEYKTGYTPVQWALRWLWSQKQVAVVLSGMNSLEMIDGNIETACETEAGCMTEDDEAMLRRVVEEINSKTKVGCTGCGYCMPCTTGVDIPGIFSAYNRSYQDGWIRGFMDYMMCTTMRHSSTAAFNCIECGKCERHCPQQINIREELKNVRKRLEGPIYTVAKKVVKVFARF